MKKTISLTVIFILLILSVACGKNNSNNQETNSESHNSTTETTSLKSAVNVDNFNGDDVGGGYITSKKYRQRYYNIPYDFVVLVGFDNYMKWDDEIYEYNPEHTKMVSFIQYFSISKEDFEKANLQMAKSFAEFNPTMRPLDFENQQTYEIYNADIIYTFDDEIINEYYLTPDYPFCADFEYESALANGTYQTQTTDWIDIEQMEAEIIAKYGETEIIPETATLPEETAA